MKARSGLVDLSCSFCGKPQRDVRKLIAGPTVYICDECVGLCNDIIAEEIERATEDRPVETPASKTPLGLNRDRLRDTANALRSVADELRRAWASTHPAESAGFREMADRIDALGGAIREELAR